MKIKKIPSNYIVCEKSRNSSRFHLAFCQHRCSDYPCEAVQEAEVELMLAGMPYKFDKKGKKGG